MQKFPLSFLDRDTVDALQGTSGLPTDTNRYVTSEDIKLNSDFKGFWDASANSPTLNDSSGTIGYIYEVSVAGTQDLGSGNITFSVGDLIIFNGTNWNKVGGGKYAQTVTVAKSGGDFTSVKAAVDSITDAASNNPYIIKVYPGMYLEAPMTMRPYVSIVGNGEYLDVVLVPTDTNSHFITGAPSSVLANATIMGPTASGKATLFYNNSTSPYSPWIVKGVTIAGGYYGLLNNPTTALGKVYMQQCAFYYTGSACSTVYRTEGYGYTVCTSCAVAGSPANSVSIGYYAAGPNSQLFMDSCSFDIPGTANIGLEIDNGTTAHVLSFACLQGNTALKVGTTGDPTIEASNCLFCHTNVPNHIDCQNSNAEIVFSGSAQYDKLSINPDATTAIVISDANFGDTSKSGQVIFGDLWLGGPEGVFPLSEFARAYATTGSYEGGDVTVASGLTLNISAGKAFVVAGDVLEDVSWDATTFEVPANTTTAGIFVNNLGVISLHTSPPGVGYAPLGVVSTDADSVLALAQRRALIPQNAFGTALYAREVIGPVSVSGCLATKSAQPSRSFKVDAGVYYINNYRVSSYASADPAVFNLWYRNGSGGWIVSESQTLVNNANYDGGSGALADLTSGYYRRDSIYVTTDGNSSKYHVVLGQEEFLEEAAATNNPVPPDLLLKDALRCASLIIQEGASDITVIIDERPKLGQLATGSTAVTDHGELSGLGDNDHPQYQLTSDKNQANGYAGLTAASKIAATQLDLATATPQTIEVSGAAVGTSTKLVREDHKHGVSVGIPVSINNINEEGVANTLARSDHTHAHGNQAGGSTHAVATTSANGFMSAADKAVIESLTSAEIYETIWAEENANLSTTDNGGREWSFGNGATGVNNIYAMYPGRITKAFIHAESPGTSVSINILKNDVLAGTANFSANGVITLSVPITFAAGDAIGFQTNTVVGSWNDVRVGCALVQTVTGLKGDQGDPGAGADLIVQKDDGTVGTTTETLNFEGSAVSTVVDEGSKKTTVTIDTAPGLIIQNDDSTVGTVTEFLNFEGTGVTSVLDEGSNKTTVTIQGTPGLTVQKDDSTVGTTTETLNFEGNAVSTVVDENFNKTTATFNVTATNVDSAGAVMNSDTSTAAMNFVNDAAETTTNLWSASKIQQEIDDGIILLTSLNALKFRYYADQLDYPRSSDWAVNSGAPSARDATYSALTVRRFDDTAVEGVGFSTVFPLLVTDMLIRIKSKAITAPGASRGVVWRLYWRKFPDNSAPTSWSSLILPTQTIPTNTNVQYYDYTAPLTTWGITAGDFTQFELVREATNGSDTLTGDVALLSIELEYS